VYPSYGSIGLFTLETFERLINEGVIQEAPYVVFGGTTEECISWGQGHIQEDGPAEWPEDPPQLLDPIDPPFWQEIKLDKPIEGASRLYAYGQETEEGFYALFYFLPLE
jgi:hypothetical protein